MFSILLCADGSYYIGVTNDLEKRLYEHENALSPRSYTAKRLPVKLVHYEVFYDINQAIEFEKQLKGWSRAKKEAFIQGDWERLQELAKNRQSSAQAD